MSDKPRGPEDHDLSGTGTPRSDDRGLAEPGTASGEAVDPAVITGATATSKPAEQEGMTVNRSGSGGSGAPADHAVADGEEDSTAASG